MANLANNSPPPLANRRWLNITRAAAVAPIVLALAFSRWPRMPVFPSGCSEDLNFLSIALWLATPPYFISLIRLMGKSAPKLKKGLAWAVVAGSFWGMISLIFLLTEVLGGSLRDAGLPLISTVIQVLLVISAAKTYYSGGREAGDSALLSKRAGLFIVNLLFFGSFFIALPDFYSSKQWSQANSAVGALREINSAQASYAGKYPQGFSTTLTALGPPPDGTAPSASAAGIIHRDLASGVRNDYTFRYTPGARDASGKITTYTLTATPTEMECTRWKRFFTDQTQKIHETSDNRLATVDDPEN
jgi:hypothetical protein